MKTTSSIFLVLAAAFQGCAMVPEKVADSGPPATAESTIPSREAIRTVQQETVTTEGQTTWTIQPEDSWNQQLKIGDEQTSPHIKNGLQHALDLAQRGAVHSAQAELCTLLALCAIELDEAECSRAHQDALSQAFTALDEANDFYAESPLRTSPTSTSVIAMAHSTRDCIPSYTLENDTISAVRAYYEFAESRLAFACGSMPSASTALYALGRIEPLLDSDIPNVTARSALFYRAALAVDGSNSLAANELGCLLVQHGDLAKAESVFRQAAAIGHCSESIQTNLAAVSRRLANTRPVANGLPGTTPDFGNLKWASANANPERTNLELR